MSPSAGLAAAAASLAVCSCATTPVGEEAAMRTTACDVAIEFGSFAAGIDRQAALRIEALVKDDPAVVAVTRSAPAIEGEYILCARTRSSADSARLFNRITETLAGPASAPVTVIGPQSRYSAPTAR
jgi:hypothetical protein